MRITSLLSSIALLSGLSFEILTGHRESFSKWYLWLQFTVCIIFMLDLAYSIYYFKKRATRSEARRHRAWLDILFLLISIPYLNILGWLHITPGRDIAMLVATLPIIRSYIVMGMVVQWLLDGAVAKIFGAYLLTIVGVTYLAALMFYEYESGVNPHVDGFGNSVWWAWMCLSTAGAEVFPVTTIGKVMAAALPCIGMMIFPVFTVYFTSVVTRTKPS